MGFGFGTLSSITSSIWLICLLPFDSAHPKRKDIPVRSND